VHGWFGILNPFLKNQLSSPGNRCGVRTRRDCCGSYRRGEFGPGGRGTFFGGVIGAAIMASIRFALNLGGIEPFLQQVVVGIVLIGAVYLDQVRLRQEEYWSKVRARQE